jgi:hypothetical protein
MEFLAYLMTGSGIISVARWFWWRINAYTEICALGIGLVCAFANYLIPSSVVVFGFPWPEMPFEIKVAIFNAINIPISIAVTFLTRPVSTKKLEEFYRKVRPGGFWKILSKETRNLPNKAFNWYTLLDVAGGILLCYGTSLTIGYSILLRWNKAGICLLLTIIGAILVYKWYRREVYQLSELGILEESDQSPNNNSDDSNESQTKKET